MIVYVAFEYEGVDPNSFTADEIMNMITKECQYMGDRFSANACWVDDAMPDPKHGGLTVHNKGEQA